MRRPCPAAMTKGRRTQRLAALTLILPVAACHPSRDSDRATSLTRVGEIALTQHACGSCHRISGIEGADSNVGPPLTDFAQRRMIAGVLPNTPANLALYLKAPRAVVPGNMMPQEAMGDRQIAGIVAYLERH